MIDIANVNAPKSLGPKYLAIAMVTAKLKNSFNILSNTSQNTLIKALLNFNYLPFNL